MQSDVARKLKPNTRVEYVVKDAENDTPLLGTVYAVTCAAVFIEWDDGQITSPPFILMGNIHLHNAS